ncbi:MAG: UPF0182 family protein, partial [Acidimicrobiia bacterium]
MFTRQPEGYDLRPRRRGLTVAAIALAVAYLALTGLGTLWTDYLWYRAVGFRSVWQINLVVSAGLVAAATLVAFLVVWLNLVLADRLSPLYELLQLEDDDELVARFQEWIEPRMRRVRPLAAAGFGVFIGLAASAWRDDFLLFANPTRFEVADPIFGRDLSFFMFTLPFVDGVVGWLFNLLAITAVLVAAVHYLNGGIRLRRGSVPSISSGVKAHVSVLLAGLALLRAVGYRIDAYQLVLSDNLAFSTNGQGFGAGYTDVTARLPAFNLLALISLVAAALFVWNIWRRGWVLVIVSVGAWLVVSVVVAGIFPAVFQRLQVVPNPLNLETPYIERNIEFTRAGFGLDQVEVVQFSAIDDLQAADIRASESTIRNLRLWDSAVLQATYSNLQEIRTYYRLDRVDTDRYLLDGELTQVMVAVRELDETGLPASNWQNERLLYTHGFGAVVSAANEVASQGQPNFLVSDVPPVTDIARLELGAQPRVYFGESYQAGRPVIVRTGDFPQEVDFPITGGGESSFETNRYQGEGGVGVGDLLRRLAFAFRYRDLNILISSQLKPDSVILMERNVRARVQKAAPFLLADSDPYPVLLDGRIVFVVDLYTVSDQYPYSHPLNPGDLRRLYRSSSLEPGVNYI